MPDDEKTNDPQDPLFEIRQGRQAGAILLTQVRAKYRGRNFRDVDKLHAAVIEQCHAEFITTWGVRFIEETHEFFSIKIRAKRKQIEAEREARSLYAELRSVGRRLDEFVQSNHVHSGGVVTSILVGLVTEQHIPHLVELPPIDELGAPPSLERLNVTSTPTSALDRLALVWALIEGGAPLFRSLTPRELAAISLLIGVGWRDRDDRNRFAEDCKAAGVSVAHVLKDETARIKAIRLPPDVTSRLDTIQQAQQGAAPTSLPDSPDDDET